MSEKRFRLAYEKGNEAIFEDLAHPYPKRMTNKEVERKLNEQHSIIRRDEISIKTMMSNMKKLEEENEQLREINKEISDDLHNCRLNKNIIREKLKLWQEVHKEYNIYSIKNFEELLNEQEQKIQRWKNLYELKDAEVTARVDSLNKVCNYYLNEVLFKSDVDPNKAVQEVINEILNTEVENDE